MRRFLQTAFVLLFPAFCFAAPPAISNYFPQTPTTGFSITIPNWANVLQLTPAGTLASGTITTPPAPTDGEIISIVSSQTVTSLTLTANTGQTINTGVTSLVANAAPSYQYNAATGVWTYLGTSAATASLPSTAFVPPVLYLSGNWYGATYNGTVAAGVVGTADIMYAHPIIVASTTGSVTFKSCGIFVGTAGIGSTFKCGIYDSTGSGGRPGNLLRAASTPVATTSSSASVSNSLDSTVTLSNGTYWIFSVSDTSTTKPICETVNSVSFLNQIAGAQTIAGAVGIAANYGGFVTSASITYANPLPAIFGTATEVVGVAGNPCLVSLQVN